MAAELVADLLATGDEQRLEVVDRLGAGADRAAAGDQQHAERFAIAATARLGEMLARERLAGGADRVELIGLRAVAARRPRGAVDLDDPLAMLEQEGGEPGAVAAAGLDRPDSPSRRVQLREPQHALVAERVGRRWSACRSPRRWRRSMIAAVCESR